MDEKRRAAFIAEHEKGGRAVVFYRDVPKADQEDFMRDVAEAYGVVRFDEHPAAVIIYGFFHKEWVANASGRWLVAYMSRALTRL